MRWHRLWKPNHTHKRPGGPGRLQVQTLRLQTGSLPLIGAQRCLREAGRGVESGMTTVWQTLPDPPNQLRLMDRGLRGAFRDRQQGLKTLLQRIPGEGGGVDLNTRRKTKTHGLWF